MSLVFWRHLQHDTTLSYSRLTTTGWELIEEEAKQLTKEQCDLLLNNYLSLGYPPNRLRAVYDND
jgi:hypothetical protein